MRRLPETHPVLQGLAAMVAVGALVALVLAGIAVAGSRVIGLDGSGPAVDSTTRATMYLPKPSATSEGGPGPLVSVSPQPGRGTSSSAADRGITLTASPEQASSMQQVNLDGTYPTGEGAILVVQKMRAGQWEDFAGITANVSSGRFHTYVQTGTPGLNKFRMIDSDTGATSNVVNVTIG